MGLMAVVLSATLLLAEPVALEDAQSLPPATLAPAATARVLLPALPARPGRAVLLRLVLYTQHPTEGGCNHHVALTLNGQPVQRQTAAGTERLVGRTPDLELRSGGQVFGVFNGASLMLMFAPDVPRAQAMCKDGQGATFCLDISDLARGVDGNVLELRSLLSASLPNGTGQIRLAAVEVGYADRALLPQAVSRVPERGPLSGGVERDGLTLLQGRSGGFGLRRRDGTELLVETVVGLGPTAVRLAADDSAPPAGVTLRGEPWGPAGWRLSATIGDLALERTLTIVGGRVVWREGWRNAGKDTRGVPLAYPVFWRGQTARCWVAGSLDNFGLECAAQNPTLYLEPAARAGNGVGLTGESDWLRLLMGLRAGGGVGEVTVRSLALAPGSAIEFEFSLTPVSDGGGYWTFLNGLRDRWGVNGRTMSRPLFWGYARAAGEAATSVQRSLAHLGPIYLAPGPWLRLQPDAGVVRSGGWPQRRPDTPATPGRSPDLDVDAWLSFAHREAAWSQFGALVRQLAVAAPQAKVLAMMHPSMEAVYKPLWRRWPMAGEAILTPGGQPFEDGGYSRAWVGDQVARDWGVLYFVPRPGSPYQAQLLADIRRCFAGSGVAGIYCDEFSWAFTSRGYSRYDYSRWDGYSADLDANGAVVRLKSDNAHVTEPSQLALVQAVADRGGFFLGNGGNPLRSLQTAPLQRFVEGGNGLAWFGHGHLSPVPLVLGNFGDQTSRQGVYQAVRECLRHGSVYSPTAVNLLLEGADNFVCKLYPITVRQLGPGWVCGEERLLTTVSRRFDWPGQAGTVRCYRYGPDGNLASTQDVECSGQMAVDVAPGGLLIAERLERRSGT